jgi:DNA-binding response OmpR family regulator
MRNLRSFLMTDASQSPFGGLAVLLLEDEYLVALDAKQILEELGVRNVEVVNTISGAEPYAEDKRINLALLDVNINGEMSFKLAAMFRQRGVPVVFATGYELTRLPLPELEWGVCLTKPYTKESMKRAILAALAPDRQPRASAAASIDIAEASAPLLLKPAQ